MLKKKVHSLEMVIAENDQAFDQYKAQYQS